MSAPWKHVSSEEEISDLSVRLKPIAGVPPTTYVPLAWALVFGVLAFVLLVLPGVRNYGSRVTVTSSPEGAEVLVDGTRIGSTPLETFIPAGTREIRVRYGASEHRRVEEVSGRRFASLLVPRSMRIHAVVSPVAPDRIKERATNEFAAWGITGTASEQFQMPPVAHEAARGLWAGQTGSEELTGWWKDLVSHASSAQIADLTAAILRSSQPGAAMTAMNLSEAVRFFIQLDNESPALFRAVAELTPADQQFRSVFFETSWLDRRSEAMSTALLAASLAPDESSVPVASARTVGGIQMVRVPAGPYVLGYPLREANARGMPVEFDSPIWVQAHETSRREFARFVTALPEWAPESRTELVEAGRATDQYLADWSEDWSVYLDADDSRGNEPLRYVSWYAAQAYVDWLNRSVPEGGRFSLPTAAQWEYAAFLNGLGAPRVVSSAGSLMAPAPGDDGALGAAHLAGNLWEWTSDWWAPHRDVHRPSIGDQRIVTGGSYASDAAGHNLVGAQPPSWTTPFLGFRVVYNDDSQ